MNNITMASAAMHSGTMSKKIQRQLYVSAR
jgi:hypothetical protein